MSWSLYRWTWLLESPLYVGATPAGSLNRCRLYISARTLWAALTAELARQEHPETAGKLPEYQRVGEELKENFRFTYLYPAENVRGTWRAWLPRYESGEGLVWRREDHKPSHDAVPNRDFRLRLLHTRARTAIDPLTDAAAEGALRETECVQTRWRDDKGRETGPVAFTGFVLTSSSGGRNGINRLERVRSLFIGGDTRYGLGRLGLIDSPQGASKIFSLEVGLDGEDPVVYGPYVLAHTTAHGNMSGAMELLVGWDAGKRTALGTDGNPLWTPGSLFAGPSDTAFRIDKVGIWHLEKEDAPHALNMGASA